MSAECPKCGNQSFYFSGPHGPTNNDSEKAEFLVVACSKCGAAIGVTDVNATSFKLQEIEKKLDKIISKL